MSGLVAEQIVIADFNALLSIPEKQSSMKAPKGLAISFVSSGLESICNIKKKEIFENF